MKKKIEQTLWQLDTLPMPDKEKILSACPVVPSAEEAVERTAPSKRRFSPRKVVVLAMAGLLLIGGGVTVAAAEAKAYGEAIDFFEQYNLSAEGFTRSEVRKIYKDIVSESFTYEKTEEALASGLEGYEIQAQPLDSEGLKRVWMVGYEYGSQQIDDDVVSRYEYVELERKDDTNGLQQLKDGEVQWSIYPEEINVGDIVPVGDKAAVRGRLPDDPEYTIRVALINEDSTLAWVKQYPCPFGFGNALAFPMYSADGTITIIERSFLSNSSDDTLWMLTLDLEGNIVNEEAVYVDAGFFYSDIIRIGDDYLFITEQGLLRKNGNRLEELKTFGDDDVEYGFTDMVEFNGLIYLSGTMIPKYHNRPGGNAYDQFVEEYGKDGITDEEVSQFYLENHTAVLMICDPKTGEPQSFYTIPGANGSTLFIEGDRLTWNVDRYTKIKSCYDMNYYLSSGRLAEITADTWQYVFTPYGQVVGEKDTGRSVEFEG